ncbi:hypothetical protein ACKWTF_012420 [Chironomus riparius]
MTLTFCRNLDQLQLVACLTLIVDGLKISFALTDIIIEEFENRHSILKRVFIHSVLMSVIGTLGLICSILLLIKRTGRQKANFIIFWLCLKGMAVFHQIFFSLDIFFAVNKVAEQWYLKILVIIGLLCLMIIEILFIVLIVNIYQNIPVDEAYSDESESHDFNSELSVNRLLGDFDSDSIITVDAITIPALMVQTKSSASIQGANGQIS